MKKMSSVSFGAAALTGALALGLLLSGCNHGSGASHAPPDPDKTSLDNPVNGEMSVATAEAVFKLGYGNGGVIIEQFINAEALGDYLNQSGGTSGGNLNVASLSLSGFPLLDMGPGGEDTFKIKMIGGLPVVAIRANAFNPSENGGNDITSVVKRVVLPETISELGSNLFADVAAEITVEIPPVVTERVGSNPDNLHGILGGEAKIEIRDENVPLSTPVVIEPIVPTVSNVEVTGSGNSVTVKLTYSAAVNSVNVTGSSSGDWGTGFAGSGTTFTATYSGTRDVSPLPLNYSTVHSGGTKTGVLYVPLATGPLTRDNSNAKTYRFFAYDAVNYAVGLKAATAGSDNPTVDNNAQTSWYWLGDDKTDAKAKLIFDAIYAPNSPTSRDSFVTGADPGKTAVPYSKEISAKVLKLFYVTLGKTGEESSDKVYIKGTDLPTTTDATPVASGTNLIIIDVGIPSNDVKNNLPKFYIPIKGLGNATIAADNESQSAYDDDTTYSHIRLRVNNGAHLVILADNTDYETEGKGMGYPCPPGKFGGGVIEVVKGGELRDGAWEGFPLGNNAVILNRAGSYLAIGGESAFEYTATDSYKMYFSGWIIGPKSTKTDTRIEWDDNLEPRRYIEVRPGKLATNANVTVKRTMGLIYSVWFVENTKLTIDIATDDNTLGWGDGYNIKGLAVNNSETNTFLFYGNPGENSIVVKKGSSIMNAPLSITDGSTGFTTASDNDITINATNTSGTAVKYIDNGDKSITGYNSWAQAQ
jgi:hypothetical protein